MSALLLAFATNAHAQAVHAVDVTDTGYDPQDIVVIVGDTVEWSFVGAASHSVTSDVGEPVSFDSGVLLTGTFAQAFNGAGIISYGSSVDAFSGTVEVVGFSGVSLNEVLADPGTIAGDANCDGVISTTQDEFVEIVNNTNAAVDLSGGTLSDAVQVRHTFPAGSIVQPGAAMLVFGGGTPVFDGSSTATDPWCIELPATTGVQVASTGTLGLNNDGDDLVVRAANGFPLDSVGYGTEGNSDESLVRSPELSRSVMVQHTTTPGGTTWSPGADIAGNAWGGGAAGPSLAAFTPGIAGQQNTLVVSNGAANSPVVFVVGNNPGSVPLPGGLCPGLRVGIQAPTKVGNKNTNAGGSASLTINVPVAVAGNTILSQAVFTATCEVSNVVPTTFQ
ncbi:MAG: lamin tail domain-containing protein [Myxococcota bacterium]